MNEIYQALVAVNPLTLIAQIGNLFLQLLVMKHFFLDRIKGILDQRREAAERELSDAQTARSEAYALREQYEQQMHLVHSQANEVLLHAQASASNRSETIIRQAKAQAARIRDKASSDIEREKQQAIQDARAELSGISLAIAEKIIGRALTAEDQNRLIRQMIDDLEEAP